MKPYLSLCLVMIAPLLCLSQHSSRRTGEAGLTASLPWVNNYVYHNYEQGGSSSKSGFFGLGLAGFYKSGPNKFSLNFAVTGDLPVPIGAFDYGKEGTRSNILAYVWEGLYHRQLLTRMNIIAGPHYINYRYSCISYVDSLPSYAIFDKTYGMSMGCEYIFKSKLTVALFYRPTLVSLTTKQYRHLLSLDARLDVKVWRKSTQRSVLY